MKAVVIFVLALASIAVVSASVSDGVILSVPAIAPGFGGGQNLVFTSDLWNGACSQARLADDPEVSIVSVGACSYVSGSYSRGACQWAYSIPGFSGTLPSSAFEVTITFAGVESYWPSTVTYVMPTMSSISPTYIHMGTGATLTMYGAGFLNIDMQSIMIGVSPGNHEFCGPVTVVSDSVCTVPVPSGSFSCSSCSLLLDWGWGATQFITYSGSITVGT